MLTDRDIRVLLAVASYYVLSRPQIQHLCFPTDGTGRVARRRLQALVSRSLLNRHRAQVVYPNSAPAGSVYYPSQKGCELLAEQTGDDAFLHTPTRCPQPHHVQHWLAVSETHIKLDEAIGEQSAVQLGGWINEWDTVNTHEQKPENRYRLHTVLSENPRLICAPDAAFTLTALGFTKVSYLEQDRGTTGVQQVVARKHKGYAEFAARALHRTHFPETNVESFTVVCITNNVRRREALQRAFRGVPGSDLWKFSSATELTSDAVLHAPIWHPTKGEAMPLVKPLDTSASES